MNCFSRMINSVVLQSPPPLRYDNGSARHLRPLKKVYTNSYDLTSSSSATRGMKLGLMTIISHQLDRVLLWSKVGPESVIGKLLDHLISRSPFPSPISTLSPDPGCFVCSKKETCHFAFSACPASSTTIKLGEGNLDPPVTRLYCTGRDQSD